MRTRKQLVREGAQHVQRLQKALEDANIKIASVISDVTGTSGRAILRAIIGFSPERRNRKVAQDECIKDTKSRASESDARRHQQDACERIDRIAPNHSLYIDS